jgi:hypothetical protein
MLDVEDSPWRAGCWMLDAGCWMLDAGCWMLDAGCWMLDATFIAHFGQYNYCTRFAIG